MGRSCMELWTNVHYVLKMAVVILLVIVEFMILNWSMSWSMIYVEAYYIITLTILVIILYGYTWFDSTVVLECCLTIGAILMLLVSLIGFIIYRIDDTRYGASSRSLEHFAIFVALTSVSVIVLIVDLILLLMGTGGGKSGGGGGGGASRGGRGRNQGGRAAAHDDSGGAD